ncbi:MAG: Trk family potassium uptake protein [Armatimonadetes bacterium]|nr:Trk family potassium uptake protein [Armatimonadota bacterium]
MRTSNNRLRRSAFRPATTIALSFAILIAVGTVLLSLPVARADGRVDPFAAIFTATSTVCVTGLVIADTATTFTTFGEIVVLVLIQLGGLGYMTIATVVAILLGRELGLSERIVLREAHGQPRLSGVIRLTRNTLMFTLVAEAVGTTILVLRFASDPNFNGWKSLYYAVFHSVSAFCNAGFDLMGAVFGKFSSLTAYKLDPVVSLTIAGLFIIGGLGYPVVEELARRKKRRLSVHARLVVWTTAALLLLGTAAILILEWSNPETLQGLSLPGKLLVSFFQSATARTAGFSTVDIADVNATTLFVLGTLMFIGASPGGTGGGVKTTTFVLMVVAVLSVLRGRTDSEVFGRRIPAANVYRALAIVILSAILVAVATMVLTLTELDVASRGERAGFMAVQFEVLSAWGTVGLSTGITPDLSGVGRIVIIIMMYVGRIGPLTAFAALAAREKPVKRRLAEEHVVIG